MTMYSHATRKGKNVLVTFQTISEYEHFFAKTDELFQKNQNRKIIGESEKGNSDNRQMKHFPTIGKPNTSHKRNTDFFSGNKKSIDKFS